MSELDWRKPVCGWCDLEAESREAQRAHALVCPKSPVVAQLAELKAEVASMRHEAVASLDVAEFANDVAKALKEQRDQTAAKLDAAMVAVERLTTERDEARATAVVVVKAGRDTRAELADRLVHTEAERDSAREALASVGKDRDRFKTERDAARAQVLDLVRARHETQALHGETLAEARADAAMVRSFLNPDAFHTGQCLHTGHYWEMGVCTTCRVSLEVWQALADTTSDSWLAERLAAQREATVRACVAVAKLELEPLGLANLVEAGEATPLVSGSDSWLAEVRATARDEALEEAARALEGEHRHDDGNCVDRFRGAEASGRLVAAVVGSTCGNCNRAEMVRALKRGGK